MIKLRETDINKLSYLLDISVHDLSKLAAMGLLNDAAVIDKLIVNDWQTIKRKRGKKYTSNQIAQALATEYDVSISKVTTAVYNKKDNLYICKQCGKTISKVKFVANDGLCDQCICSTIKVHSYELNDDGV